MKQIDILHEMKMTKIQIGFEQSAISKYEAMSLTEEGVDLHACKEVIKRHEELEDILQRKYFALYEQLPRMSSKDKEIVKKASTIHYEDLEDAIVLAGECQTSFAKTKVENIIKVLTLRSVR